MIRPTANNNSAFLLFSIQWHNFFCRFKYTAHAKKSGDESHKRPFISLNIIIRFAQGREKSNQCVNKLCDCVCARIDARISLFSLFDFVFILSK